ncbi:hypothetical protein DYB39_04150 [Providencia rettgeri]|uniref:hypothetical protein n=1 Tax=Providencia rettgeri TaxID=587 RepID=UPI000E3E914B|nr:hypothetical protein DYB39_03790 [Providencia rettgeri]RFT12324.1 hypothetical protein DYB39_04150 [Providencia rettgeri]
MTITLKVYKDSPEYKDYMNARFPKTGNYTVGTPATFEFKGHRWRYEVTSFDDNGDYDLLWRPDGKEPELMLADISFRDYLAAKAMQGILANPAQLDNVNDKSAEWVARDAYRVADAMLKARG